MQRHVWKRWLSTGLVFLALAIGAWLLLDVKSAEYSEPPEPSARIALPGPPGAAPTEEAPGWFLLRVVEKGTGCPVVTAGVNVFPVVSESGSRGHFLTREDGTVWIGPADPGSVTVRIDHGHYVWVQVERYICPAGPGGEHPEVVVRLARGLPIAGRIRTTDGRPSKGRLRARALDATEDHANRGDMSCRCEDGTFRFMLLPAGRYEVSLWRYTEPEQPEVSKVAKWVVEAGREDLVLEHEPLPDVHRQRQPTPGEVEDGGEFIVQCKSESGIPVETAQVEVVGIQLEYPTGENTSRVHQEYVAAMESRQGSTSVFRIRMPDTPVWVRAWKGVAEDGALLGSVIHGPIELRPGPLDLTLPGELTISGRVVGEESEGLGDITVSLMPDHPSFKWSEWSRPDKATTRSDGSFRFGQLGHRRYLLTAWGPPEYLTETQFARGGTHDHEIQLPKGIEPEIRVVDSRGEPVRGAEVFAVVPGMWTRLDGVTDGSGIARLRTLDPEAGHNLWIFDRISGRDLAPFTCRDWRPRDMTVTLPETATIRGRVLDGAGEPFGESTVCWDDGSGLHHREACSTHGTFELRVPAGRSYVLRAVPWNMDAETRGGPEIKAAAGDHGVVLHADRGIDFRIVVADWPEGSSGQALLETPSGVRYEGTLWNWKRGVFRFRRLPRNVTYRLSVMGVRGGLALTRDNVRAVVEELEVELGPGLVIEGEAKLPAGAVPYTLVAVQGRLHAKGALERSGQFRVDGLSPGVWRVIARAVGRDGSWEGEAEIPAGGVGRIMLRQLE